MRDYRDLRRVYQLTLTQAFFALLEQKVLEVWETLARMGYGKSDYFDFTESRWKALPVERQITYASGYQRWYAERLGVGVEQSFEGSVFRLIPPGNFTMGSPENEVGRYQDEVEYNYYIDKAFWVGMYLVTNIEYKRARKVNISDSDGDNLPVSHTNWEEAQAYCSQMRTQLLDELEWEYACRAGTTTAYLFGNDPDLLDEYAWYSGNSDEKKHPVGEKKANAWGLYDILGNVMEWCEGWYNGGDSYRVARGGGYYTSAKHLRSSYRESLVPSIELSALGFRVCKKEYRSY